MKIMGIDPGRQGAFVILKDNVISDFMVMPLIFGEMTFEHLFESVLTFGKGVDHVFLERAVPMAMGSKHAFTYGREFAMLEISVNALKVPLTYVEPAKWSKEIHEGISKDLKPKAKSVLAVQRLFPNLLDQIPCNKNKKMHEGVVDALLIAEYGRRKVGKYAQVA